MFDSRAAARENFRDINGNFKVASLKLSFGCFTRNGVIHYSFQGFFLTPNIKKVRAISKSRKFTTFLEMGYIDQRRALRARSAASERFSHRNLRTTACWGVPNSNRTFRMQVRMTVHIFSPSNTFQMCFSIKITVF